MAVDRTGRLPAHLTIHGKRKQTSVTLEMQLGGCPEGIDFEAPFRIMAVMSFMACFNPPIVVQSCERSSTLSRFKDI